MPNEWSANRFRLFVVLAVFFASASSAVSCGGDSSGGTTTAPNTIVPPAGATVQMVNEGRAIFNGGSCQACHGQSGTNGPFCPDLTDNVWLHGDGSYAEIIRIVTNGMPVDSFKSPNSRPQFWMFPRGGQNLTDDQVKSVAAYVWTLSHHS
jgi:mono/diheme cytochrome c family protein